MNRVVKILMRRDNLTRKEAEEMVAECAEAILDEGDDSLLMEMLGLEPDYLQDVLEF